MDFEYIASGTITIFGCSGYTLKHKKVLKFPIGSKVYILNKAKKGVLEFVYIKNWVVRTDLFNDKFTLYIDTLNGLWNEGDLCDHETAVFYATEWLEFLKAEAEEAIYILSCKSCP